MYTTSASLLHRLREPKPHAAWDRFVRLYTPLLYHWARRLGLQQDDAADLAQDVLLTLLAKLPEFSYDSTADSFRAWLRVVTHNKWRDRLKLRASCPLPTDSALANQADSDRFVELAEAEYRQQLVQRAMQIMQADFDEKTWKACWQTVVDGRSADEVGADLGMKPNAVYAAKFRVIARLRQELAGLLE